MVFWLHRASWRCCLGVLSAGLLAKPLMAEEVKLAPAPLFLDTRTMIRHAGADMPPTMLLPALATSPAMLSAKWIPPS